MNNTLLLLDVLQSIPPIEKWPPPRRREEEEEEVAVVTATAAAAGCCGATAVAHSLLTCGA